MVSEHLPMLLFATDSQLGSIDDNTFISKIESIRSILRLVFAPDENSDLFSHSTQIHAIGIEEMPDLPLMEDCYIGTLRISLGSASQQEFVLQVVWHFHWSLSNVWIEFLRLYVLLGMVK
jgi:hypothetical protein